MPALSNSTAVGSAVLDGRFRPDNGRDVVHWEARDGKVRHPCAHLFEEGEDALLDAIAVRSDRANRLIDERHLELLFVPHGARAYRDASNVIAVRR